MGLAFFELGLSHTLAKHVLAESKSFRPRRLTKVKKIMIRKSRVNEFAFKKALRESLSAWFSVYLKWFWMRRDESHERIHDIFHQLTKAKFFQIMRLQGNVRKACSNIGSQSHSAKCFEWLETIERIPLAAGVYSFSVWFPDTMLVKLSSDRALDIDIDIVNCNRWTFYLGG